MYSNFIAKMRFFPLATVLLLSAFIAYAQQASPPTTEEDTQKKESVNDVKFTTEDEFMLGGKYYAGQPGQAGVLLLHDCNHDSSTFDNLGKLLSNKGMHAFALDFRGYGTSTSAQFSHTNIKRNSKDISTYQTEVTILQSFWQSDVLAAHNYLRERVPNTQGIAVVSAGCSAAQAIYLAQKARISGFVVITPELDYMQKEHYKNLIDIPVYFIASAHNTDTYQTAKELFDWNGDNGSTFQIMKGIWKNHSLLNGKSYLAEDITLWLKDTMDK